MTNGFRIGVYVKIKFLEETFVLLATIQKSTFFKCNDNKENIGFLGIFMLNLQNCMASHSQLLDIAGLMIGR